MVKRRIRMSRRATLTALSFLAASLLCGAPANAQTPAPDAVAAARELAVAMRAADQLKLLLPARMQQLKPANVEGRPQVEKDFDALMPTLMEGMLARSSELVNEMATIYARNFTAAEIRQVTAFYRGPVGQKFLDKMPAITQESMAAGQRWG